MTRGPLIWVTRAEPGASATARRLEALGLIPIVSPLFEIRPVEARLSLDGVAALAFTSANAVRAFAERTPDRRLRVFAVGDATAQAAKAAGFRSVLSTRGDVTALAAGIRARKRELAGPVLHPGAAEPAGDLAGDLAGDHIRVVSVPLYETVSLKPGPEVTEALSNIRAATAHSPRGARALARFLRSHPTPEMSVLCLSNAVARPLSRARNAGRLKATLVAEAPNEDALLQLIGAI